MTWTVLWRRLRETWKKKRTYGNCDNGKNCVFIALKRLWSYLEVEESEPEIYSSGTSLETSVETQGFLETKMLKKTQLDHFA